MVKFAEIIGASHASLSTLENGKSISSQTLMRATSDLKLKLDAGRRHAAPALKRLKAMGF